MFTVPLSFEAHAIAQRYQRLQSHPKKAKQAYLNALAVYSVDFYLRCLGFETDLEQSDYRNPLIVKFMDVADLSIKQVGKLECRPVLPNAQVCQIPPDVWFDRVGYVAIQLSQTLKQGTLMGFTTTAIAETPLNQLQAISKLPEYLNQIRQSKAATASLPSISMPSTGNVVVNLRRWLESAFDPGWERVEDILSSYRQPVCVRNVTQLKDSIRRAKLIDLGMQLGERMVALPIAVTLNPDATMNVLVQAYPGQGQTYLPPNLQLTMFSESGEPLQEVCSRRQDNYIQLRPFKGHAGDRFSIQVTLNDVRVTEDFML